MPYPLPAGGPPYSEDLRWFLVAVPDDVAFVRAAMGAYTELTKYWKWGHEGTEPGRNEAAQVRETAVAATLEALEMGFPDILLGYIDGVEGHLQQLILKDVCCGSETPGGGLPQTDYSHEDGDPVPQNVIDAGYATDLNDQAGMTAYKCMISHLYVRNVAGKLNEYAKYFDNAGDMTLSVAGVAAIAAALFIGAAITGFIALPLIGIEMLLGIGAAAGIFGALGELGESALQDAANELVANADDYVCAIYLEDGPAAGYDAFSALVTTNMSAAMASLVDLIAGLQDLASLYTGRYADSDIAAELAAAGYDPADFTCACTAPTDPAGLAFTRDNWGTRITPDPPCPGGSLTNTPYRWDAETWAPSGTHGGSVQVYKRLCSTQARTALGEWGVQITGHHMTGADEDWFPSGAALIFKYDGTTVLSTVHYTALTDGYYQAPTGCSEIEILGGDPAQGGTWYAEFIITEGVI